MSAPHRDAERPTRRLLCCCCGRETRGRQWWNQDTGHGLGACCVDFVSRNQTPEWVAETYGVRGVHYALEEA